MPVSTPERVAVGGGAVGAGVLVGSGMGVAVDGTLVAVGGKGVDVDRGVEVGRGVRVGAAVAVAAGLVAAGTGVRYQRDGGWTDGGGVSRTT